MRNPAGQSGSPVALTTPAAGANSSIECHTNGRTAACRRLQGFTIHGESIPDGSLIPSRRGTSGDWSARLTSDPTSQCISRTVAL
jgi:hypothetical protein